MQEVTADTLLELPLFEGEAREAVEWIAERMRLVVLEAGESLFEIGEPVTEFRVILEGEIHFLWTGAVNGMAALERGEAVGLLPFSRMKSSSARALAYQRTVMAAMDGSCLRELVYRAPLVAERLVAKMTDRTRFATRMQEASSKLIALGKLSAGLAHELNNPASAAVRSSARLREVLTEQRKLQIQMRGEVLPAEARARISAIHAALTECGQMELDPLERTDREMETADWLADHELPDELAGELVDAGITIEGLESVAGLVEPRVLGMGLRLVAWDHEILCLTRELEEASRRISDLVSAVKSYSYMDQSSMGDVDIEKGIDVTLRMFQHQLKHGIHVEKVYAKNLPLLQGNGSALNQIWTNLIDNAIDAMETNPPERPRVLRIQTCQEPEAIWVEISDTGPGIPEDLREKIFDPFFTTKKVGEGTGLGLDIVQRIVRNHRGQINVHSGEGFTRFEVRLPLR